MSTIETLKTLIADCIRASREQGWDGNNSEFAFTREDMDFIVERFGARPTREQWDEAGLTGWIGSAYVGESAS